MTVSIPNHMIISTTNIYHTKRAAKRDRRDAIRRGEQVGPLEKDGNGWAFTTTQKGE